MNTIAYLNDKKYTGVDDIKQLRADFFKQRITVSYEVRDGACRRLIFSCAKSIKMSQKLTPIQVECNGLIVETDGTTWTPLVVPIPTSKCKLNTRLVNEYLSMNYYNIYPVYDGTIINLYFYDGAWVISTARGFQMNRQVFNEMTYEDIISDILQRLTSSLDEFYANLDTTRCYSFGFKHPDIHPFLECGEPVFDMWYIQSVALDDILNVDLYTDNEYICSVIGVQQPIQFSVRKIHELFVLKEDAINTMSGDKPCFGFILRGSADNVGHDNINLLLESSLMRAIRQLWYDGHSNKFIVNRGYDRTKLILLNSYLDESRTEMFTKVFPQFVQSLDEIRARIQSLVDQVVEYRSIPELECAPIVRFFDNEVSKITSSNSREIIASIIVVPKYIDTYYKFLTSESSSTTDIE